MFGVGLPCVNEFTGVVFLTPNFKANITEQNNLKVFRAVALSFYEDLQVSFMVSTATPPQVDIHSE